MMRSRSIALTLVAVGIAAAVPTQGVAQSVPSSAATQPAVSAAAMRFGELYMPIDLTLTSAVAGFDKEFGPSVRANASVAELDRRFPGLIDAAASAARAMLETAIRREAPAIQQRLAVQAQGLFSDSEIEVLNNFLASPAGRNLQRVMAESVDASGIAEDVRKTGEIPTLDGNDIAKMLDPAAISKLSQPDVQALILFGSSAAGKKFATASPQFMDAIAAEMNGLMAAMQGEIQNAVVNAITNHISKKPAA